MKLSLIQKILRSNLNGGYLFLAKRQIQSQSEGAEVFYKNIFIEQIAQLPNIHKFIGEQNSFQNH